ncbi:MAG: VWA-like domain-containing protein [Thermofilaceae archaeon]
MAQAVATRSVDNVASDVKKHVYEVMVRHPHLFRILMKLRVLVSKDVPTAAVSPSGEIIVNPVFWSELGLSTEKVAILLHEALHIGLNHHLRAQNLGHVEKVLWNIATDCVINRVLRLITSARILDKGVSEKTVVEVLKSLDPKLASMVTEDDIAKMNEEQIYALLHRALRSFVGRTGATPGLPTDKTVEKGSIVREPGNVQGEVPPVVGEGEKEEEGEGASEEAKAVLRRAETVNAVRSEVERHAVSAGREPGELKEMLEGLQPYGRINWTKYLVNSASRLLRDRLVSTWSVPHRRFPDLVPGYRRLPGRGVRMIVAVDVSGSIDVDTLRRFLEETLYAVELLSGRIEGEVWFWDTKIQGKVPLREFIISRRVEITGGGGTVIDPVADELLKEVEKNPVDLFIVFTDGMVNLDNPGKFNEAIRRVKMPIIVYTIQPIKEVKAEQIHYPII